MSRPSHYSIDNVPPEILEKILVNLEQQDVLNFRLINSQWKAVLSRIMEHKLLGFFANFASLRNCADVALLIPNLWIKTNRRNPRVNNVTLDEWLLARQRIRMGNHLKVLCPSEFGNGLENPFPSSSLRLGIKTGDFPLGLCSNYSEREIYPFFQQYGYFLKILVLDSYRDYISNFCKLLSHLPNLKSLTLEAVQLHNYSEGETLQRGVVKLPPLSKLTHLRFSNVLLNSSDSDREFNLELETLFWILEKYGEQLVGLTVNGKDLFYDGLKAEFI